ncbi:hypothetical protein [Streptomyces sp. ISL-11]|uniref:hypothetical protein n=1 Tax=Streptomyces sp. ISL-11 TaxID=2819174 RepID=UPI001BEA0E1F|nr:hypothetical protein [Streptomyces sp. ISL-11]MBT2385740.1 hypothetical protein [Streptomyces sp. ISL-11]
MRIVMGAQNCGFGPAAELVAVSRLLTGHERIFVGDGVAAAFARRNADAFDDIREGTGIHDTTGAGSAAIDDLLKASDQVVSVMDADLVVRSVVAGRPVVMVDSLLSFWQLGRPLAVIRDLCESLPRSSFSAADRHLGTLSPHERVVAAHLLATHSVVQNFPGATERMAELVALGSGAGPAMHLTGSIVDVDGLRNLPPAAEPEYDLLINVGGFKNFLLDFDVHNDYMRLLHRWIADLLRDWGRFRRVLVCGGPFGEHRERDVSVAGRRASCRFLAQRELLRHVASTPHYLLAPGLTALHESLSLGRLPLAIHEQHYAHVFTVRRLEGTHFGRMAARFADVLPGHHVPEDDFAGTAALVEIAGRVREDDELYAGFRRTFNERIEHYLSLTPAQRRQGVGELREALAGDPLSSVLARVIAPPR